MLFLDENLAVRLVSALAGEYPGCAHVSQAGLSGPDRVIWQYARERGLIIVTKDEDFQHLSVLYGAPPKVIWIRLGNCSTADVLRLLGERHRDVFRFQADAEAVLLALA